jgi:tRNA(Ile)-lysidine synthase
VEAVEAFASAVLQPEGFLWLIDPMNTDPSFDRSFLRGRVFPVLQQRFPAAARAAGRSASLAAEAAALLDELGADDGQAIVAGDRLSLPLLRKLPPARQRGWASPPERRLRTGLEQLLGAAPGRAPVLGWAGHEIRRFREHLYLLDSAPLGADLAENRIEWADLKPLRLGGLRGELSVLAGTGVGLATKVVASGLQVAFRSGGERVRAGTDRHHRTLKYLFQSRGILPWMRGHVPLLFAQAELAAVADLWIADWAAAQPSEAGLRVVWSGHAPIQ